MTPRETRRTPLSSALDNLCTDVSMSRVQRDTIYAASNALRFWGEVRSILEQGAERGETICQQALELAPTE